MYIVDRLLPIGLNLLCGSSKIGKSWLALDLVISVSKGISFLGFNTNKSCREYCVAREENTLNLVKMLDFDLSFTHFSFIRNKDGYLDKKRNKTIPVEVFLYLV